MSLRTFTNAQMEEYLRPTPKRTKRPRISKTKAALVLGLAPLLIGQWVTKPALRTGGRAVSAATYPLRHPVQAWRGTTKTAKNTKTNKKNTTRTNNNRKNNNRTNNNRKNNNRTNNNIYPPARGYTYHFAKGAANVGKTWGAGALTGLGLTGLTRHMAKYLPSRR